MTKEIEEELPWKTKMKNERPKSFKYFITYRDLGEKRTLEKVRKKHDNDISLSMLRKYSVKYHWRDRIDAKQDFENCERQKRLDKEKEEFYKESRETMKRYQKVSDYVVDALYEKAKRSPGEITRIANSLRNVGEFKNNISRLQMRVIGDPETITQSMNELSGQLDTISDVKQEVKMIPSNDELMKSVNTILEKGSKKLEIKEEDSENSLKELKEDKTTPLKQKEY